MSSNQAKKTSLSSGDNVVYVTNKYSKTSIDQNDMLLLAIKMSCQKRTELIYSPVLKGQAKVNNLQCISVETKNHSAILFIGSTSGANIKLFSNQFGDKLKAVLKSAHEKVYFVEKFTIDIAGLPLYAFLAAMGSYTFSTQYGGKELICSYFKNEKQNDNNRFTPISLEIVSDKDPVQNDLYLYLKRNNRYIKYVKQGQSLSPQIRDRFLRRGIHDLYMQTDQELNIQQQKATELIESLLKDFYRID
jgi:hypothetical protein